MAQAACSWGEPETCAETGLSGQRAAVACAWLSLDPPPAGTRGPQPHWTLWWLPTADCAQLEARLEAVGHSGAFACVVIDWSGLASWAVASRHWPRLRVLAQGGRPQGAVAVWAVAQGPQAQGSPAYVAFPCG